MELNTYLAVRGRASVLARKLSQEGRVVSPAYLYQMATGRRPVRPPLVPEIVKHTDGQVREWDLRPKDWHLIWRDLIGSDGAPEVSAELEQKAA